MNRPVCFDGARPVDQREFVTKRVHAYYWVDDLNCATTSMKVLAEKFDIDLSPQVIDATLGMHGAGLYGAQCGLVEGTLMFIGIIGRKRRMADEDIVAACRRFAAQFEKRFGALVCKTLRPQGFHSNNPPHLCARLTRDSILLSIKFVTDYIQSCP